MSSALGNRGEGGTLQRGREPLGAVGATRKLWHFLGGCRVHTEG